MFIAPLGEGTDWSYVTSPLRFMDLTAKLWQRDFTRAPSGRADVRLRRCYQSGPARQHK